MFSGDNLDEFNDVSKGYYHNKRQTRYSINSNTGWKKLLWLKQPYPDNYTDSSFLSQLKRNSTVVKYSYRKLASDFSLIVLHLSLILSVIVVFYGIYRLDWNSLKPTILSTILTVVGFIFYVVNLNIRRNRELIELQQLKIKQLYMLPNSNNLGNLRKCDINDIIDDFDSIDLEEYLTEPSSPNFFETFKSSLLIILYLLTLSPVLKSLTKSTSSDSIWALSSWLCILNVMFNDYQIDFPKLSKSEKELHWKNVLFNNSSRSRSSPSSSVSQSRSSSVSSIFNEQNQTTHSNHKTISIQTGKMSDFDSKSSRKSNFSNNIAVANAIVLASRLQSNASAFSLILFTIQACGLFPIFNNYTRQCGLDAFHYFQLISIVFTVDILVWYLFGLGWLLVWVALHLMIVFVGPWYFLALQKYKNELQGPWDPAKPVVKSF